MCGGCGLDIGCGAGSLKQSGQRAYTSRPSLFAVLYNAIVTAAPTSKLVALTSFSGITNELQAWVSALMASLDSARPPRDSFVRALGFNPSATADMHYVIMRRLYPDRLWIITLALHMGEI